MRQITLNRKTKETAIELFINLDGNRVIEINTGIPFFDHMLTLFAFHGNFDLKINCTGDIEVDDHHTIEDIGLVLGDALSALLKDKSGIRRYASTYIPMDESLARVVIDISNRPTLIYKATLDRQRLGTMDTQNVKEFLKAFVSNARLTLHAEVLYGENDHHKVEALFKAFGRTLKSALTIESDTLPSSKGVL